MVVVKIGPGNSRSDPIPVSPRNHWTNPDTCAAGVQDQLELKPDFRLEVILVLVPLDSSKVCRGSCQSV